MSLRKPRFGLKHLLAAVGVAALFLAASVLAGGFGASLVLIILMITSMTKTRPFADLFLTADGVIWWGGILAWISAFFAYSYGPMGGEVRYYALMRNVTLSWIGLGWMVVLSPVFFGALAATFAFLELRFGALAYVTKLKWIAVSLFAFVVATSRLLLAVRSATVVGEPLRTQILSAAISIAVIVAALAVMVFFRCSSKSIAALHAITVLPLLIGLYPMGGTDGRLSALAMYGSAYWLLCAGLALITGAAIMVLVR